MYDYNLVPRVSPLHAPWDVKRRDPGNEDGITDALHRLILQVPVTINQISLPLYDYKMISLSLSEN